VPRKMSPPKAAPLRASSRHVGMSGLNLLFKNSLCGFGRSLHFRVAIRADSVGHPRPEVRGNAICGPISATTISIAFAIVAVLTVFC
jgi:hypothetical protein